MKLQDTASATLWAQIPIFVWTGIRYGFWFIRFWTSAWNIFDTVVVSIGVLESCSELIYSIGGIEVRVMIQFHSYGSKQAIEKKEGCSEAIFWPMYSTCILYVNIFEIYIYLYIFICVYHSSIWPSSQRMPKQPTLQNSWGLGMLPFGNLA